MQIEEMLPGGVIEQRVKDIDRGDCFSACVSMLTGIDLDLLPVHPPTLWLSDHDRGEVHVFPVSGQWTEENLAWRSLLDDNGYDMVLHDDPPEYPYIAWIMNSPKIGYTHAIIAIGPDKYVDPAWGQVLDVTNTFPELMYTTVRKKGE